MFENAVSLVNLGNKDKVLDIGYGNGHILELIYKKKAVDMYGIDISEDAKKMAVKKNKNAVFRIKTVKESDTHQG